MGKENWIHGFFLYSYSSNIVAFFREHYPTLGIFFESRDLERHSDSYTHLQKDITQTIGIVLEEKRQQQ